MVPCAVPRISTERVGGTRLAGILTAQLPPLRNNFVTTGSGIVASVVYTNNIYIVGVEKVANHNNGDSESL